MNQRAHVSLRCLFVTAILSPILMAQAPDAQIQQLRVYYLKYASAELAAQSVAPLLDTNQISVMPDPRLNALFVRSDAKTHEEVEKLLELLDNEGGQANPLEVRVFALNPQRADSAYQVLQSLNLSVKTALNEDGNLIARGAGDELEVVAELLKHLDQVNVPANDVTVEIYWLTEAIIAGAAKFQGATAEKLSERGFKELSVVSVLELSTRLGSPCEASGAASRGSFLSEIMLNQNGSEITMDLSLEARYAEGDVQDQISLRSMLTTPLNRWIIFGVAQRATQKNENHARDLFLVRLREVEPLE